MSSLHCLTDSPFAVLVSEEFQLHSSPGCINVVHMCIYGQVVVFAFDPVSTVQGCIRVQCCRGVGVETLFR